MIRRLWFFAALPTLVALGLYIHAGTRLSSQAVQQRIAYKAEKWVAFSADFRQIESADPLVVSIGRIYRSSDGSERWEVSEGTVPRIMIKSISQSRFYRRTGNHPWNGPWLNQPMILPAEGWKPHYFKPAGPPWGQISGVDVWRQDSADGRVTYYRAPSLDMFMVRREWHDGTGRSVEYLNFVLGEPDPSLFEPPTGAEIKVLTKPGGIIPREVESSNRQ